MAAAASWGRYPRAQHRSLIALRDRHAALPPLDAPALPHGNGRSYGDVCLNDGGHLLLTRSLDRFIAFDPVTGILRCEAGVLLGEILELIVPQGWFLPVTPGTRFVTVGGAIANDVHGKNHHRAGCFSDHVRRFELLRSDGTRLECGPDIHPNWFRATAGGLGLTGVITWAELALRRIASPWMTVESHRFHNLDEFFALSAASERDFEYSVAWIDCAAAGKSLGRGHFIRANHAPALAQGPQVTRRNLRVPLTPPISLINGLSLRAFNAAYFHRQRRPLEHSVSHYQPYFYPLDALLDWNRIYGPRGFLQYQCVVASDVARAALNQLLQTISASGTGSFLAVLKQFGERRSAGILSFPRPGATLALDFPNAGPATLDLLERLDAIVADAGGAVYPAKDARLSAARFRQFFPGWEAIRPYLDPALSSGFWRRVTES